jgi:segregation and condensation protein B
VNVDEDRKDRPPEPPEAGPEADRGDETPVAEKGDGKPVEEPGESLKKAPPGKDVVEALLFAAEAPLSPSQLASLMGKRVKAHQVRQWVKALDEEYKASGRAFHVLEISGGFRLLTKPAYFAYVKNLLSTAKSSRLSEAALDTLAVVAYKQPIVKADINQIRGVESGPILKALVEKGLVRAVDRAETLGRPIRYGTARKFLDHFGLKSLKELPKLEK